MGRCPANGLPERKDDRRPTRKTGRDPGLGLERTSGSVENLGLARSPADTWASDGSVSGPDVVPSTEWWRTVARLVSSGRGRRMPYARRCVPKEDGRRRPEKDDTRNNPRPRWLAAWVVDVPEVVRVAEQHDSDAGNRRHDHQRHPVCHTGHS